VLGLNGDQAGALSTAALSVIRSGTLPATTKSLISDSFLNPCSGPSIIEFQVSDKDFWMHRPRGDSGLYRDLRLNPDRPIEELLEMLGEGNEYSRVDNLGRLVHVWSGPISNCQSPPSDIESSALTQSCPPKDTSRLLLDRAKASDGIQARG